MFNDLLGYSPLLLALYASSFAWLTTALGSFLVFFFPKNNRSVLNLMMGFAAGIMMAASYWSMLEPAIAFGKQLGMITWIPLVTGFLFGAAFIMVIDKILPFFYVRMNSVKTNSKQSSSRRSVMIFLAMTMHNLPEGLAIGVAFGALSTNPDPAILAGAVALSVGISIQSIPEGAAVSLPLKREGYSRLKAFHYGQLSGIVIPLGGVLGALLVIYVTTILPFALAFAAGTLIYVVIKELIPESQQGSASNFSTIGVLMGFATMMFLDVALK